MRNRFTRPLYALVTAITVAGTLGLTAGAASASGPGHHKVIKHATIACDFTCFTLYNVGDNISSGTFITQNVYHGASPASVQRAGAPITQWAATNTSYKQDFSLDGPDGGSVGRVSDFVSAGLISPTSYAALHYWNHFAFEAEYTPYGVQSGMCVGVARPSYNGEGVTTQPCGVSARTLWIFDPEHGIGLCLLPDTACPIINGSDSNFSTPEVLTGNVGAGVLQGTGAHKQFQVRRLQLQNGVPEDNQLNYYEAGPVA